ncbi:hypothetical protein ACFOY8_15180 [Thalassospira xianhensis]|uniref:Uncharacterized protein n=1 Tax=Thalassospira xianhensis MCCC 1A02616 TaxID=1177929 RepID=A0A367UGT1_9PROT|nr:hypothetical protein [Thalassospira xianhensis]RCK07516.1 hypothetical protein TH5_00040 [Thalassospira xianhensis MCCC 1A02616]
MIGFSFYETFGNNILSPICAIAYDLSEAGEKVRQKPETYAAFKEAVFDALSSYADLKPYSRLEVESTVDAWLKANDTTPEKLMFLM